MLQLKSIHKTFNESTPDEKRALDGIDLTLTTGDFVTVIGSNGAGKSTLMNVIAGVLTPDFGDVTIENRVVTNLKEHKRSRFIGRVFQDPMAGTAPNMTIEENLSMAFSRNNRRSLHKGVTKKRRAFFKEQLASLHLGLEDRLNAKVGLLSGGERQALSLLMATFTKPNILLLDEHTAALDPSRAQLIIEITKDVVERFKLTTLMVTHNMQQAVDVGSRLIVMDSGKIIAHYDKEEKKNLTIEKLLEEFKKTKNAISDRTLLN